MRLCQQPVFKGQKFYATRFPGSDVDSVRIGGYLLKKIPKEQMQDIFHNGEGFTTHFAVVGGDIVLHPTPYDYGHMYYWQEEKRAVVPKIILTECATRIKRMLSRPRR